MAKRKNKKNKSQPLKATPKPAQKVQETSTTIACENFSSSAPAKTRSKVSIPVFFSGMFLTLVLGLYLGSLLPDILRHNSSQSLPSTVQENSLSAPLPQKMPVSETQPSETYNVKSSLPKDIAEHAEHLKAELASHPDSAKTWVELGDLYFDANLPRLAVEAYGKALALEPKNPDVITDMGIMYREMGEYNKALECFRKANEINPDHTQSLYNEGVILSHDMNDKAGAMTAWQKLLKINPNAISPTGKTVLQMIEELK